MTILILKNYLSRYSRISSIWKMKGTSTKILQARICFILQKCGIGGKGYYRLHWLIIQCFSPYQQCYIEKDFKAEDPNVQAVELRKLHSVHRSKFILLIQLILKVVFSALSIKKSILSGFICHIQNCKLCRWSAAKFRTLLSVYRLWAVKNIIVLVLQMHRQWFNYLSYEAIIYKEYVTFSGRFECLCIHQWQISPML